MKERFNQEGTTLIEILVSIVVMAIGLLGLASLQMNAMKYQKIASQRSEAVQAAYDYAERMRANWVMTTPANYTTDRTNNETNYTQNTNYVTTIATSHTSLPNNCAIAMGTATGCTAAQIAANDKVQWLRSIETRLVGGAGYAVRVAGTTASTFDITVMWREQTLTGTDPSCPGAVAAPAGVRCFTLRYTI